MNNLRKSLTFLQLVKFLQLAIDRMHHPANEIRSRPKKITIRTDTSWGTYARSGVLAARWFDKKEYHERDGRTDRRLDRMEVRWEVSVKVGGPTRSSFSFSNLRGLLSRTRHEIHH